MMYDHGHIHDTFAFFHQKCNLVFRRIAETSKVPRLSIYLFIFLALSASFYPQITSVNAQNTFQPTRASIYGTFYYPWYKNPTIDGGWSYWQDSGFSPPDSWFSNYLPLPPGTKDAASGTIRPTSGLYSSRDKSVFYWQLSNMAKAKLEFAISSWWGRSDSPTSDNPGPNAVEGKSDFAFRKIITDWMNLSDNPYPNLRWTIYYEKEGFANPSLAEIATDLFYMNDNYINQPAYLKVDGRPVIFVYGSSSDGCATVDRWLQARAQTGVNFYLVLKVFSGYANCAAQPDSWHQYAPAVRSGDFSTHSSFISPGFWKVGDSVRLARNLAEFDTATAAMVAATTKWKLVQTWNEWGEGTSVEPGIQVQQTLGGAAVLAANGSPFEDKYIEVLSQRFPALQAGTGAAGQVATAVPTQSQPPTSTPNTSPSTTFTFAAGGDIGANSRADSSLRAIPATGASFFLALGDMDYDETSSDAAFCDYVKQRVGSTFPFEIVTGNHEEGSASSPGPDGHIGDHAACLPDYFASKPVIPGKPAYPANYYFDYPQTNPIMRVIMISANLTYDGVKYNFNRSEQTNYNALAARIDEAKQSGLWVVVGTHKVCLTAGDKPCEIGADLMNLLVEKKVDLVLHGHDHNYQRSKQIALGASCASLAPGSYNSGCIVDDGSDNTYTRGAGALFLISGTVGRCCYNVKANDGEAGYFAKMVGVDGVNTNGFVAYTVSASRIDARVINSVGSWGDSFSIVAQTTNATATPTSTPQLPTSTPLPSKTPVPPTATPLPTNTSVPPTATPLPTNTSVPPTPTILPSNTSMPPTPTHTGIPPSATAIATNTPIPTIPPPTLPPAGPSLVVNVLPQSADIGQTVLVMLNLQSVNNLFGLQVDCRVNPAILSGTGLSEGDGFNSSTSFIANKGFQSDGSWIIGASRLLPNPPITGDVPAFTLAYVVRGSGMTDVSCVALAVDKNGADLPLAVINSTFTGNGANPTTQPVSTATPTITPLPTLQPTATSMLPPTPLPQGSSIRGVLTYQSRVDQSGIKVELYTTSGQFLTETVTVADGSFNFSNVPDGEYVVQATARGHLALQHTALVTSGGSGYDIGSHVLKAGDTDGNQIIDLADAAFIGGNFNLTVPPAPDSSDLNADGRVDIRDLVLVGGNFGLIGPIVE